ncbi:OLC1v1017347C2 [Oldenlandia corymbosa var. corymbosa]|uniref:OLC1v1017347C2 n=1 Tax=Oldenlandia corymbosa var. corymbosa TaxID=529605 RepID=A0AAV1E961_OLDCO|nr:OLC1v1017347C2 [Oldenlandia corymbosa var. corymbosa]
MELQRQSQITAGQPIRCKAAIARKAGEPLIIEEIEVAPPKPWEVRIKILCASLCHTDVTFWKMSQGPVAFFPRIFGHEGAGIVESVGENVEEMEAGDMVIPTFQRNCGECRDCKSPKGNHCSIFPDEIFKGMPRDGTIRFSDVNGRPVNHFLGVSCFAEYTVVDITHVVKMSLPIPIDKACLLSCGVSTGLGAACKFAEVEEGSTVVIFGLGAVGLAVAEGARICKASRIIGVDKNPAKFEIGKKFGVTDFINPTDCTEKSVSQVIQEMTNGGADYCFECIGLASLVADAFSSCRQGGGKTVVLGLVNDGSPISINPYEILTGKSIMGCFLGGIKPKLDIPNFAKMFLDHELNLDGFITHQVDFVDINKAFDLLLQGKSLRCTIWMDKLYSRQY